MKNTIKYKAIIATIQLLFVCSWGATYIQAQTAEYFTAKDGLDAADAQREQDGMAEYALSAVGTWVDFVPEFGDVHGEINMHDGTATVWYYQYSLADEALSVTYAVAKKGAVFNVVQLERDPLYGSGMHLPLVAITGEWIDSDALVAVEHPEYNSVSVDFEYANIMILAYWSDIGSQYTAPAWRVMCPIPTSPPNSMTDFCAEVAINAVTVEIIWWNFASSIDESDPGRIGLQVYPNPATDYVVVRLPPNHLVEKARVEIVTSSGRRVYSAEIDQTSADVRIPLSPYANGGYFLRLLSRDGILLSGSPFSIRRR